MSTTTPPGSPRPDAPADLDAAVRARYSEGASARVDALCCPVDYDAQYLEVIPEEVVAKDYGCGDPSKHVRAGETVLDLGSGTGKICFIASQVVGPSGKVIGVDMNDDMLEVARRNAPVVAERIGFDNVSFVKARIEDLQVDRAALDAWLAEHPIRSEADFTRLEQHLESQRRDAPAVGDGSIDVVVSNCVLNLVMADKKPQLFREIARVLRTGGRAVISDIVSDEPVPAHLAADPELWAGCISGALTETDFLTAFEDAGFGGLRILARGDAPWQVVEGIAFRSVTVEATRIERGACLEQQHAVIYGGPWKAVEDDDGHRLLRGQPMAVCGRTFRNLTSGPYAAHTLGLAPQLGIADSMAEPFVCTGDRVRTAAELKGLRAAGSAGQSCCAPEVAADTSGDACCEPGTCC